VNDFLRALCLLLIPCFIVHGLYLVLALPGKAVEQLLRDWAVANGFAFEKVEDWGGGEYRVTVRDAAGKLRRGMYRSYQPGNSFNNGLLPRWFGPAPRYVVVDWSRETGGPADGKVDWPDIA
jgi:hypothetical protein